MRVVVEASAGPRTGGRWLLRPGDKLSFGRTERSDIMIGEDTILSSLHFRVIVEQGVCVIEDLQSTNGTWIGEQKIAKAELIDGDEVVAGKSRFVFRIDARDAYERTTADANAKLYDSRREDHHRSTMIEEDAAPPSADKQPAAERPVTVVPNYIPAMSAKPAPRMIVVAESAGDQVPSASTIALQLRRCESGLWVARQTTTKVAPATMVHLLVQKMPAAFIIDAGRADLLLREEDPASPTFLMGNLPAEVAAAVSPRLIQPFSGEDLETWMNEGWGNDGMMAVFSEVDTSVLLHHFQSLMHCRPEDAGSRRGMIGLCWPSVLESLLSHGKTSFANEVIEPITAILIDSDDSPGGWALIGDDRMSQLLTSCNLPFV